MAEPALNYACFLRDFGASLLRAVTPKHPLVGLQVVLRKGLGGAPQSATRCPSLALPRSRGWGLDGRADPLPAPRSGSIAPAEITDTDERTSLMLAKLFAHLALLMTDSKNVKPVGRAHGRPAPAHQSGNQRKCPWPVRRVFQITTPVRHDFRAAIGDYIRHGGSPPSVQGIVTGHWKMQAHGTGRQLRRRQWIEPYWRGPEDAPIALRPHKL
jgi:hypothetical protein